MTKAYISVAILATILFAAIGCVDMGNWYQESHDALNANINSCLKSGMTKSDLVMAVGSPSSKETVDDGDIWIYELVDKGDTTTNGVVVSSYNVSTFSATTSTQVDKSTVIIKFNRQGTMVSYKVIGPARGQFRFLRCAVTKG